MTKKIYTNKCELENMTEKLRRRTFTVGLDQKTDEYDQKSINEINSLR